METQTMVEKPSVFFALKNQSLTRSWPLDWRCCFGQALKWDTPLGLDFGLGLWELHTIVLPLYYDAFGKCKKCRLVEVSSSH